MHLSMFIIGDDDNVLIVCVQLNAYQLAKENTEQSCSDNIDAAERRAELREAELNNLIIRLDAKHGNY